MKTRFLFPSKFKYLGYLLAIPGFILGYLVVYRAYEIPGFVIQMKGKYTLDGRGMENFTNELALTLVIIGLLLISFSKVKREDELTAKIRLNALYWAILVNYGLYSIFSLLVFIGYALKAPIGNGLFGPFAYSLGFTVYNFFVPLLIFIGRFYYLIYRNKNEYTVKPVRYLPYKPYRLLGKWVSLIIILLLIVAFSFHIDFLEISFMFLPFSLLLWVYSREKKEDEYINSIRLEAMQMAVYVNYAILLLSDLLVYGLNFLSVQFINLVTIPLIFIAWFQYRLYRPNKPTEVKSILL